LRPSFILLVLLFTVAVDAPSNAVPAQASSPRDAWSKLIQAFSAVQGADSNGVSRDNLVQLSTGLNTALGYYTNASRLLSENNSTGAEAYASISINLSSNVSARAVKLGSDARAQLLLVRESAYGVAFVMAVISAYVVTEFHRIQRLWRRRKADPGSVEVKP
jgi:hypothetical protein